MSKNNFSSLPVKVPYILTILSLLLFACKKNQRDIPFNQKFIEKEVMFQFQIEKDSILFSPLVKSFNRQKYKYKKHCDTLKIKDFNGRKETNLLIKFMSKDSIQLVDISPDSIPVWKRRYVFYKKNHLYDSTLQLKSISFQRSLVKESYPLEAFMMDNNLDFYLRKDFGIVETSSDAFTHKMGDYKGKVADSTFKYVQDLLRLLDFKFIDKKSDNFSTAHTYWNVEIEFENGEKYEREAVDLTFNLGQIWEYNLNLLPKSIKLTELEQVDGIAWMKNE